jgi:ABC-2 type transport system permease protein
LFWLIFTILPFFGLVIIFEKFKSIGSWNLWQVGVLYSILGLAYDTARMIGREFDAFHRLVKSGDLDLFFIRPIPIFLQVLGSNLFLRRIAGIIQYITIYIICLANLEPEILSVSLIITSLSAYLGAFFVFLGLLMIYASTCIFTIERNSFVDFIVDLSLKIGYLPLDVLNIVLKSFFLWVIPLGIIVYTPIKSAMTMPNNTLKNIFHSCVALAIGTAFIIICYIIFNTSLKKYKSVNC